MESTPGPLPRVFMIQVDSCPGENKNAKFLAFLGWLVAQGVFDTIIVSYLIPGHTHIDVDRNFSFHETFLRSHDHFTMDEVTSFMKHVRFYNLIIIIENYFIFFI